MPPNSAENVVALPVAVPRRGRSYELEFLPAAVEILETPASPLGRAVALAIALFVAIAILWACVGEIDIVAALNPGESGVIKTIAVEEGEHVAQGQLLVELDATETGADRQKLSQQLAQTRLDIARLRAILGLPGGELIDTRRREPIP